MPIALGRRVFEAISFRFDALPAVGLVLKPEPLAFPDRVYHHRMVRNIRARARAARVEARGGSTGVGTCNSGWSLEVSGGGRWVPAGCAAQQRAGPLRATAGRVASRGGRRGRAGRGAAQRSAALRKSGGRCDGQLCRASGANGEVVGGDGRPAVRPERVAQHSGCGSPDGARRRGRSRVGHARKGSSRAGAR